MVLALVTAPMGLIGDPRCSSGKLGIVAYLGIALGGMIIRNSIILRP